MKAEQEPGDPETIMISIRVESGVKASDIVPELEQAGLYFPRAWDDLGGILGGVFSIEWVDNIDRVPAVLSTEAIHKKAH